MKKAIRLIAFLLPCSAGVWAQDPQFTQFYANPLYLNPALAGSKICPRICFNYRYQWPAISGQFVTTSVSYDRLVNALHGGMGLLVTNDEAGQGTYRTTCASAIYSYIFKASHKVSFAAAIQATYYQKSLDWSKLNFGDQIDPRRGFVYTSNEIPGLGSRSNVDISTGIACFSDRYFFGFAANHLTQPDESLLASGYSPLPVKYTAHAGANIPLGPGKNPDAVLSPNIIWQKQQDFQQLDIGMYIRKNVLTGGIWYRNSDAFILLIGVEKGTFRMGYSYDLTVSRLGNATAGSHEISLGYILACKPPRQHYRTDSCPSL